MFKKSIFIIILITLFITSFTLTYTRVRGNGAGNGYSDETTGDALLVSTDVTTSKIEKFIIDGAVYFLEANADIQKFLTAYEKTADSQTLNNALGEAIEKIRKAKGIYVTLLRTAVVTPYNREVQYKLWLFDYDGYMCKHNLNRQIFLEVRDYLAYGNLNGVFERLLQSVTKIEDLLQKIKDSIYNGNFPEIEIVWALNEAVSESTLFGSYVARVFYEMN